MKKNATFSFNITQPLYLPFASFQMAKFSTFITLEESNTAGGFGDGVSSWLLENNFKGKLKRIGLPDSFVQHGSRNEVLKSLGLNNEALFESIKLILNAD